MHIRCPPNALKKFTFFMDTHETSSLDPKERFSQIEKKSWNQDWRFS
jgi:hypothetical protein